MQQHRKYGNWRIAREGVMLSIALSGILLCPLRSRGQTETPSQQKKPNAPPASQKPDDKPPTAKPLPQLNPDARYDYQGEATVILQHLFSFHSPYRGPNSLHAHDETELTHSYTLFLGARPVKNVEVFLNPEVALGRGISNGGVGLGGYSNGDDIGQPGLRPEPYLARYFIRWRIPLPQTGRKSEREVQVGRAPNFIDGEIPARRIIVTVGKYAISDIFDVNSYANDPRTQFLNNAFGNSLAFDMASETRGYNLGATVAVVTPNYAVRLGTFAMPTEAGGPDLAYNFSHDHSEHLEVQVHPRLLPRSKPPMTVRLLAFRNVGTLGNYRDALAQAPLSSTGVPDITTVRQQGSVKYGFGLNFEQALLDGGATGVFGRLGWNDGATESSTSEADRFLSFGGQLSGVHWRRKEDIAGVAFAQSGLSGAHRDYLAAGGSGLSVGDGKLHYSPERIVEVYYSYQLTKPLALTLDYQIVNNPGYNRDRGPAGIVSLRAHLTF